MTLAGKRALVTGADGFIGSHLVEALLDEGCSVTALSQYNSFNHWGWLEDVARLDEVEVITGDIRDSHFCRELTRNIDVIFHLAALIPIPYSYRAPESYIDTNVKGTLHLCQAALANGVGKFIHTSTSEVYGTARYVPIDEQHPLNAQSPYSASKIAADAVAVSFYHSFKLPVIVARPFNTYGPRQSARAVIPTIVSQIVSGRAEIELGDLNTTRDFTFVTDTCAGFIAIARMDKGCGEVFHIGSDREIRVGDLLTLIGEVMGADVKPAPASARMRPPTSEVYRLRCNNSKLKQATGFMPEMPLRDGLKRTADWFRRERNATKYKAWLYNI